MNLETRIANIYLEEMGYVNVEVKNESLITSEDVFNLVESIIKVAGDRRRLILINGASEELLNKQKLPKFLSQRLEKFALAIAVVEKSIFKRLLSRSSLKQIEYQTINTPIEIFTNDMQAKTWLAEQRDMYHLDGYHSAIEQFIPEDPNLSYSLFMSL